MTNLPSYRRALPIITMCLILFVLAYLPHLDASYLDNSPYSNCADLVKKNPAQALAMAKKWRAQYPDSLLGKHCEALALFATKDYAHAADDLMDLGKHVTNASPMLAVKLYKQASAAYAAAGKADAAKQADAAAILVHPGNNQTTDKPNEIIFRQQPPIAPTADR